MEGRRRAPSSFFPTLLLLLQLSSLFHVSLSQQKQQPIKNVVVLVMENRSFDHIVGWMKKTVNPHIDGVTGEECNPVSTKPGGNSRAVCVTDDAVYVDPDPGHAFEQVTQQIFGSDSTVPTMDGFVEQALTMKGDVSDAVMKGFKPDNVPVYSALVSEFALFDRWFSSLPGPTQPNRLFVYSATSHGLLKNDAVRLAAGLPQKTIFESLVDDGHDFAVYFQSLPSVMFYRNLRRLKYSSKIKPYAPHFHSDAAAAKLPALSVIEPRYFDLPKSPANDDHPSHDVANGQRLVKEVYETLRASPQWNQTLFVVTYDEHGGFYDHVPTPYVGIPNPDGINGPPPSFFKFDRLGVRIPTIMVSPWIKKGIVVGKANGPTPNSEYEHSSVAATIKKIFNLKANYLTHRDAWAGTFEGVVGELTAPRTDCPKVLPAPTPLRKGEADENRALSEFQEELVQLAAALKGDHKLIGFPEVVTKNMTVKQASEYVDEAVSSFLRASEEALKMGADGSAIVDMRPSLTTRSTPHRN